MSSKKYRKALRLKRIHAHYPQAVRIYYNQEEERLYQRELNYITNDMSATEIFMRTNATFSRYYGYAYNKWIDWCMGMGERLYFVLTSRSFGKWERGGKIRIKDIHIIRRI